MRLGVRILSVVLILTMIQVFILRFINPPFTVTIAWKTLESRFFSTRYTRPAYHWRPLKEISPYLTKAVLAGEDQRFLSHRGFDFIEMSRAFRDVFRARRVRGASTITMQVARTLFLWPDRSVLRKILEAYYTVIIEIFWDKKRILEMYLNTVDWGSGIMGAEAASRKYFHTTSALVTPSQAASMAAVLPYPHKWSPVNPDAQVKVRMERIMKDMARMKLR